MPARSARLGAAVIVAVAAASWVIVAQAPAPPGAFGRVTITAAPSDTPLPPAVDPIEREQLKHAAVDRLAATMADRDTVRVIVGVETPFVPEGRLDGTAALAQRQSIATATSRVLQRVPAGAVSGLKVFDSIPYFAAEVDPAGLRSLDSMPDVVSIQEDRADPPALADSTSIIGATTVWSRGVTASGWTVAILDTGVQKTHPFLSGKVVSEACYSTTSSSASATSVCPGGAASSTASGAGEPCTVSGCDHGTHVAGIAAGRGSSFSGVAKDASIVAVQVFTRVDSTTSCSTSPCALSYASDRIAALQRVYALRTSYSIASVNMSIGGGYYSSQSSCDADNSAEKAAIDTLRSAGIATVISSGNDGYSYGMSRPGCISTAVSVGATTKSDLVASYANTASFLSLLAPGSSIYSSIPTSSYGYKNGTSMAAPHVTGTWALARAARSSATVTEVLAALRATGPMIADPISGYRFARIAVSAALAQLTGGTGAPGAPTSLTATSSGSSVTLSWVAPSSGGTPTGYAIEAGSSTGLANLANFNTGTTATTFATSGVASGTYYVRVRASNASGTSGPSNEATLVVGGTCSGVPGAPTGFTLVSASGGVAVFTWNTPSGSPTGWVLEAGSAPGLSNLYVATLTGPATRLTVSGVPRGTYYVRIRAQNACGTGSVSNEAVVTMP